MMADQNDALAVRKWWTPKRQKAALLYAKGEYKNLDELAGMVPIGTTCLDKWIAHPYFQARVIELQAKIANAVVNVAIKDKNKRLERYNDRWHQIGRELDEKLDPQLLREERELAKQAAVETGEWAERHKHDFSGLSDEELIERAKEAFAGAGAPGAPSAEDDSDED